MNNRQLKFRAWDKERKRISLSFNMGDDVVAWSDGDYEMPLVFGLSKDRLIIQQFTGLQDSTGKDIYEGDIVKTDPNHTIAILKARRESEEYTEYTKGEVRWWNEGFAVCQENIGATRISEYTSCDCCPCGLTIIGNIFEGMKDLTI